MITLSLARAATTHYCCLLLAFTYGNAIADTSAPAAEVEQLVIIANAYTSDHLAQIFSVDSYTPATLGTAQRIEDAIADSPGVQVASQNAGMETSLFVRGYVTDNGNVFVNGHQDIRRFFPRDLATVGHVSIIKGHVSALLGSGSPGGAIVYSTKRPQSERANQLDASLGSDNLRRLALDSTGNLMSDVDYRLVLVEQSADSFMANVGNDKQLGLISLQWQYAADGSLRFETEYDQLTNPYNYGTVRINNHILYDHSYVDPRANSDRDYLRNSLYWEQALSDNWGLSGALNVARMERDDLMMGFYYKLNEQTLLGHWADSHNDFWQKNLKLMLNGDLSFHDVTHSLNLGIEANHLDNDLIRLHSTGFTLDPLNPDFNHPEPPRDKAVHKDFHYADTDKHIVVTDSIALSQRLLVDVGTRVSDFESEDRLTGKTAANNKTHTQFAGINFQWRNNLSLYSNYTQSFEPNSGQDKRGQFFVPRDAKQIEAGIRWQPTNALSSSLAVYELEQRHLLTKDPTDRLYQIPTGARQTRGLELTNKMALSPRVSATLSYSHMDNRVIENLNGLLGKSASGIPEHMGAAALNWKGGNGTQARITLSALGSRYGDAKNSFRVPGYARLDTYIAHDWARTSIALGIENLLDKRYIAAPFAEDDLYQGKRRELIFTLSRKL